MDLGYKYVSIGKNTTTGYIVNFHKMLYLQFIDCERLHKVEVVDIGDLLSGLVFGL